MTDEEMARLKAEGDECRKELERRIAPMKQGPFTPPDYVLRLQAEVERLQAQSAGLGVQRLRARQERDEARAQAAAMREALEALGVQPEPGYCFCRTQEQADWGHTGECQEAQAALASDAGRESLQVICAECGTTPLKGGVFVARCFTCEDEVLAGYLSPDDAKRMTARAVLEERAELRRSLELTHEEEKRALVDRVVRECIKTARNVNLPLGYRWGLEAMDAFRFGIEQAVIAIRALDRSKLLEDK